MTEPDEVLASGPEREAVHVLVLHLPEFPDPIHTTVTAFGLDRDHDLALATAAAEITGELLGLEVAGIPAISGGMGWVVELANTGRSASEQAVAVWAADSLDLTAIELETQW